MADLLHHLWTADWQWSPWFLILCAVLGILNLLKGDD